MIGFYCDDDASQGIVVAALLAAGIDVRTSHGEGLLGVPDEVHFRHAASLGLVMVTSNQGDFLRLHTRLIQSGESHTGLLIVQQQRRLGPGERIRRLIEMARELDPEDMRGEVQWLHHRSPRPDQP